VFIGGEEGVVVVVIARMNEFIGLSTICKCGDKELFY
jgi:hypothetical protein